MKFRNLHIEQFGCFENFPVEFSEAGLQLIYGPNEAGKTTFKELLVQSLFGFDERGRYIYADSRGEIAAKIVLTSLAGDTADYRRRKGRANRVVGKLASGGLLDDGILLRLLGTQEAVYKAVYAVTQEDLSKGEKALADIQDQIFGGGLFGAVDPKKLLEALIKERDDLLRPKGRAGGRIHTLYTEIKELEKNAKRALTKPSDYAKLAQEADDRDGEVTQLGAQLGEMHGALTLKENLKKAVPHWRRRRELVAELEGLGDRSLFPIELVAEYRDNAIKVGGVVDAIADKEAELQSCTDNAAVIEVNPGLLAAKGQIEEIEADQAATVKGQQKDLPKRKAEAKNLADEIEQGLRPRQQWSRDKLLSFSLDGRRKADYSNLKSEFEEISEEDLRLEQDAKSTGERLSECSKELEELPEIKTGEKLESILDTQGQLLERQVDEAERRESSCRKAAEKLYLAMRPRVAADIETTVRLSVPPIDVVKSHDQTLSDLRQTRRELQGAINGMEDEVARLNTDLAQLDAGGKVPTESELVEKRAHRDEGWQWVRGVYVDRTKPEEEASAWHQGAGLTETYEQAIDKADELADAIRKDADNAARKQVLLDQLRQKESLLATRRQELEELEDKLGVEEALWKARWLGSPFEPGEPEDMSAWIKLHQEISESYVELQAATSELTKEQTKLTEFESALREELKLPADGWKVLEKAGRKILSDVAESQVLRRKLAGDIDDCQRKQRNLDERASKLVGRRSEWDKAWRKCLDEMGFVGDWSLDQFSEEKDVLLALRDKVKKEADLNRRVEAMEREYETYAQTVDELTESILPKLKTVAVIERISLLRKRAEEEARKLERKTELEERARIIRADLKKLEDRRNSTQRRNMEILSLCGVADEAALHAAERNALRWKQLTEDIRGKDETLAACCGTTDRTHFEELLEAVDAAILEGEIASLSEEVVEIDKMRDEAVADRRAFKEKMAAIPLDSEAAHLFAQADAKRAELLELSEEWATAALSVELLQQAIVQFERENQPGLLAEAARIFATMTGGKYTAIRSQLDDTRTLVVEGGGVRKTADQLSTGTREQLYLALRIAYVLQASEKGERLPMILDDVLVNFDGERCAATIKALNEVADRVQIVLLTCHEHVAELVGLVCPGSRIDLSSAVVV